ncbi:hypothetical protein TNCV_2336351 [Trichonephila clavipes]|uniref:Uncharacterized protein n=1 Tax=Trichonephila clavipes TaxID=2585209 RepID=A0A8X6SRZ1_TRICX|nr:hypothetical protein TNCV_2336351 [Trichonephila clavipes]
MIEDAETTSFSCLKSEEYLKHVRLVRLPEIEELVLARFRSSSFQSTQAFMIYIALYHAVVKSVLPVDRVLPFYEQMVQHLTLDNHPQHLDF